MAYFDWDLDKFYWPKDRVLRWWAQGWDWDGLKSKKCPHTNYATYADYYEQTARTVVFPDPRGARNSPSVCERDYWGDRWLTEFPARSGKFWDPYHLPLFDPLTGELSPKHRECSGPDAWDDADFRAFLRGFEKRMCSDGECAPLSGVVITYFQIISVFGECSVNLEQALFDAPIWFYGVSFGDDTNFSMATFRGEANFSNIRFGKRCHFSKTYFGGPAIFLCSNGDNDGSRAGRVEKDGKTDGVYALRLDKERDAREECAFQDISFEGAEFWGDADFSGRHFAGKADFFGAKFHKIPNFHRAAFAQDPIWSVDRSFYPAPGSRTKSPRRLIREPKAAWLTPVAARINRLWSAVPHCDWDGEDRTKRSIEFELAYRRLKTLMQGMGARTAEHFFYTMEIKSRIKRKNVSRFEKVCAYLYWWTSDFGLSLWRPLGWLIAANAGMYYALCRLSGLSNGQFLTSCKDVAAGCWKFLCSLFGAAPPVDFFDDAGVSSEAFSYLARNFVPGGWLRDVAYTADIERSDYQDWVNGLYQSNKYALYLFASVHEIATLVLLFLFALALKRRFQIK